jgi:hypothetical protein
MSQECKKNIPRGESCQSCHKLLRDFSDLDNPYVVSEFMMSATSKKNEYYFCSNSCQEAFINDNRCVKCHNLAGIKKLELQLEHSLENYGEDDVFTRSYERRFDDIGRCKRQIISDKVYCYRCLFKCDMCNVLFLDKDTLNKDSVCHKCANIIEDIRENYSCVFCKKFYKSLYDDNNYDIHTIFTLNNNNNTYKVCTDCLDKIKNKE